MEEEKIFELLTSVKNMVKTDPAQARTALTSHPNLAYALMKEMVILDVIDPEVLTKTLHAATSAQPTPTATPPTRLQSTQPGYPPNGALSTPAPAPVYPSTSVYSAPSSTPGYPTPPPATPGYPTPGPSSIPSYPPAPGPTPTYPPTYSAQSVPPAQPQPQPPSIPPHMYQARQQQQQQQPSQPPQSRGPPPSAPPPATTPATAAATGLAPEQQLMIQRLASLTPDQIAALPPADRAALMELRRTLGLS